MGNIAASREKSLWQDRQECSSVGDLQDLSRQNDTTPAKHDKMLIKTTNSDVIQRSTNKDLHVHGDIFAEAGSSLSAKNEPSFGSEYDRSPYPYNLMTMFPRVTDSTDAEEEKCTGMGDQYFQAPHRNAKVVFEGPLNKFMNKNNNLLKRYLVLNQLGLFVYKDQAMFNGSPEKPLVIIPLAEIQSIN